MSRRVNRAIRVYAAGVFVAAVSFVPSSAVAQTTVVIKTATEVAAGKIQGGTYANTVFAGQRLATKVDPTTLTYTRRSVLKFDTHNTVPAATTIQSAKLTLTVSKADAETRTIGLYRLSNTFDPKYVTWNTRKSGTRWTTVGGDFKEKFAQVSVGASVGAKVTFDVTALVQGVVSGKYGSSRYTRVGLADLGSGSKTSYKEFYNTEAADAAVRPVLTVVYGGYTATAAPPPSTGVRLKVLDWNTHKGVGTDGKYNLDRFATYIAKFNPDIVSLNEVTRYAYYNTSEDQAVRYVALLKAKTGRTWYYTYRTTTGTSSGSGNLILSRFPIASTSYCQLSQSTYPRVAVNAGVYVNGRLINVWSTHLDSTGSTSTYRIAETKVLLSCLSSFSQQRIVAGDFNARDYTTEINLMESSYYDGWAEAAANGTAIDYPGNTAFGATRTRRIDYIWASKSATALDIKSAQVFDTRDANGHMPSDHKPVMVTFEVK